MLLPSRVPNPAPMIRVPPSFRVRIVRGAAAALVPCTVVAVARPPRAAAQTATQPVAARPGPLPYDQTLSAGLLLIPFGVFAGEYERRLGAGPLTAAVTGTYSTTTQLYPRRDRWVEGRIMYYPGGRALEGFAVGVSAGAHRAERRFREDPAVVLAHDGGATLGAIATYNTYYGPQRRYFFGPGIGFKRVLKSIAVNSPLSQTYIEGRAALGIAF